MSSSLFKKIVLFSFLFFSLIPKEAHAYTNKLFLKGGLSFGASYLRSRRDMSQFAPVLGLASYYGKKWVNWEFGVTSQANIGWWSKQTFLINDSLVSGKGHFRNLSFGPYFRYYFNLTRKKHWQMYTSLAPLFGLKTFKFSETSIDGGSFVDGHKITYRAAGGMISVGFEEQLDKIKRPSFIELTYRYFNSSRQKQVGGTTTEVETIVQEEDNGSIAEHTFVITWGILVF